MPSIIRIVKGDLLDQKVEVIVNAWNRNIIPWWLLLPQGVSGAIKRRGGLQVFRELAKHGPIPLGGAVHTTAGKLPFKGIIHVAGINMFWFATEASIRKSVSSALRLTTEKGYCSIAFPLIGARNERNLLWRSNPASTFHETGNRQQPSNDPGRYSQDRLKYPFTA